MHSVKVVSTRLSIGDLLRGWRVRWNIGRDRYRVEPGLFAVGNPTADSPVLVTANYKLTFDKLRKELCGLHAWILVLDTQGVNVWCAAGKGTFGTRELERRLLATRMGQVVSHRKLILPQLGATGVSAPQVLKDTGWRVVFGPVRACDIPVFLAAGMKKDAPMRRVEFSFSERMVVAPVELVQAWPFLLGAALASVLLALPVGPGYGTRLTGFSVSLIGAVLAGTLAVPALLPVIPFRAFSLKGAVIGVAWGLIASVAFKVSVSGAFAFALVGGSLAAFLGMNFTGATTFTCQSGAEQEVRRGTLPMIVSLALGVVLLSVSRVLGI
ncbi:MAG TPA: mercury methylation corrinoid protein HgcA [Spirochaetia bacterium]|nr:mercury methylation corrinoid protein HgcA [Spirochaetia bacterium]